MEKAAISTMRKTRGAKRASSATRSARAGAAASTRLASVMSVSSLRRPAAEGHHRHQPLFIGAFAVDLAGDPALAHRHDPIADRQHFGEFRRNGDNCDAPLRHLEEEIVHLDLRADIYAASRLVDDQHL